MRENRVYVNAYELFGCAGNASGLLDAVYAKHSGIMIVPPICRVLLLVPAVSRLMYFLHRCVK